MLKLNNVSLFSEWTAEAVTYAGGISFVGMSVNARKPRALLKTKRPLGRYNTGTAYTRFQTKITLTVLAYGAGQATRRLVAAARPLGDQLPQLVTIPL